MKSKIKLLNLLCLLLLVYSNASLSLPGIIVKPDLDFLGLIFVLTTALCVLSFFAGWAISRSCRQGLSDRISLMFGLGMNNNGTGLVLASLSLVDHPLVMLPILFYNLVQHLIAGLVDKGISLSLPKSPA